MLVLHEKEFISNPRALFATALADIPWIQAGDAPRMEFHHVMGAAGLAYGQGDGRREFASQPLPGVLASLRAQVQEHLGCVFENVSAKHYRHGGDHVGWHADDGPTMCNSRPTAVLSLGATRNFAYRHRDEKGPGTVLSVESGDLLIMPSGMQQTHVHKLLKANSPLQRICVVFRGICS